MGERLNEMTWKAERLSVRQIIEPGDGGFLSMLFGVSVGERLRISHEDLKEACNAVLSAIVQRLG